MKARIVSLGAATPLGLTAEQTAFGLRAGLFCPRTIAERDLDGEELGAVLMSSIHEEICGWERMVSVALPALREALEGATNAKTVFLALPFSRPGFDDEDAANVCAEIKQAALDHGTTVVPVRGGNDAFGKALALAVEHLETRPTEHALVGATDTWHEPATYRALDREFRILSGRALNGFIPSEGAAFVGLAGRDVGHDVEASRIVADVVFTGFADESLSNELDGAWTDLVDRAAQALESGPVPWVLVDQCTERHRGRSWDRIAFRLGDRIDPESTTVLKLADRLGDAGAASGAILLVYAAVGLATGFAPGKSALVALGSDHTGRASFGLRAR